MEIHATHEKVEGDLHDERGPGHEDLDGVAGVSVGQTSGRNTVRKNEKFGGKAVAHYERHSPRQDDREQVGYNVACI